MTNKTLHNLQDEWYLSEHADNGFYEWWRENYPTVQTHLCTSDGVGLCPASPEPHDMQVILKEWQKTHAPQAHRIKSVTNRGMTVIPEDTPEVRQLLAEIERNHKNCIEWWDDVDYGRLPYSDQVADQFDRKDEDLRNKLYALGKRWLS